MTMVFVTGDKFLCWPIVSAVTGADWTISPEFDFRHLLFTGSNFCEEKRVGNQRKITARD